MRTTLQASRRGTSSRAVFECRAGAGLDPAPPEGSVSPKWGSNLRAGYIVESASIRSASDPDRLLPGGTGIHSDPSPSRPRDP